MNVGQLGIAVPFLSAMLLSAARGPLARRLPPRHLVALLAGSALVISLATGLALYSVAVPVLARFPLVAGLGHWSATALNSHLPAPVGVALAVLATTLLLSAATTLVRAIHGLVTTARAARMLQGDGGRLCVVTDEIPSAYAVGAWRGRIVVTTAMLAALSAPEQDVLFAHEEGHLRDRHNLIVVATRIAAAANPILRPLVHTVRNAVERAADEYAAEAVGDRRLAARSVARAALARRAVLAGTSTLAATGGDVPGRVASLLAPPRPAQNALSAAIIILALTAGYAALVTADGAQDQIEHAQTMYAARHHDRTSGRAALTGSAVVGKTLSGNAVVGKAVVGNAVSGSAGVVAAAGNAAVGVASQPVA